MRRLITSIQFLKIPCAFENPVPSRDGTGHGIVPSLHVALTILTVSVRNYLSIHDDSPRYATTITVTTYSQHYHYRYNKQRHHCNRRHHYNAVLITSTAFITTFTPTTPLPTPPSHQPPHYRHRRHTNHPITHTTFTSTNPIANAIVAAAGRFSPQGGRCHHSGTGSSDGRRGQSSKDTWRKETATTTTDSRSKCRGRDGGEPTPFINQTCLVTALIVCCSCS